MRDQLGDSLPYRSRQFNATALLEGAQGSVGSGQLDTADRLVLAAILHNPTTVAEAALRHLLPDIYLVRLHLRRRAGLRDLCPTAGAGLTPRTGAPRSSTSKRRVTTNKLSYRPAEGIRCLLHTRREP